MAIKSPNVQVEILQKNQKYRNLIDIVIGKELHVISSGFNLIGDQLVIPQRSGMEFKVYFSKENEVSRENILFYYKENFSLFVSRILELNKGWVEVIPFNDNLVFLKGVDGSYDFVFKGLKNKMFEHQLYQPFLKRADVPFFDDDYHFQRWFYFEYNGMVDEVIHKAEIYYYENDCCGFDYPGVDAILKKYLYDDYKKTFKKITNDIEIDGFKKIFLKSGKKIMVSNLVSISDFKFFESLNHLYFLNRKELLNSSNNRGLDCLEGVNDEVSDFLPVTLTWYDVLRYIKWFNEKHRIEARLLTVEEYKEISPFQYKRDTCGMDDTIRFYSIDGKIIQGHPPYMSESDFQKLRFKFNGIGFLEKNGINFANSNRFAEWLMQKTCIRSNSLTSFYGDEFILRSSPYLGSTGKYKGTKIGFRICYELNES